MLLIKGCEILQNNGESHWDITVGDIAVKDGKILHIGRVPKDFIPHKIIDGKGKIAVAGFINAHTHSYANLLKGLVENHPLETWMYYAFLAGKLNTEDIYISAMLGCIEMIRSGVTSCLDHLATNEEGIEAALKAYMDSGMGVVMSPMVTDKRYFETLPLKSGDLPEDLIMEANKLKPKTATEIAEFCEFIVQKWHGKNDGMIHIMVGPSGPQRCSDELLMNFKDLSEKYNIGIHTHLLESKMQAVTAHEFYGCSMVEHLERLGVLTEKWSMAHTVWVSDAEINLLAKRGVSVVHNPVSNLTLGSGISPVNKLYKNGVHLALGTDGSNCGGSQNIFSAMSLGAMISKVTTHAHEEWQSASNILKMATEGGARVIGKEKEIGSLQVGKRADIVLLEVQTSYFTPRADFVNQLVYSERGESVDTVIIKGNVVMENKEIKTFDEKAILKRAQESFVLFEERMNKALKDANGKMPYIDSLYKREIIKDLGFQRTGVW